MATQERPYQPPFSFRIASAAAFGSVGFLSRSFLFALNKTQVHGLDRFLEILDSRRDESKRTKGLITVSNHVSVLDDPMIWGVLPNRYFWNPNNMRWSLGSYDICFKNGSRSLMSAFFSYGNTLPTHRAAHSPFGGLFQPTMTQCIRLLSDPHGPTPTRVHSSDDHSSFPTFDPFSLTYTTNGTDTVPAPSAYPSRRFSWVHIFPEGMIHQHPDKVMRYFKWGVARLILEAEPCPDVLPMWIDGPQNIMDNDRPWPRPLPRPGRDVQVHFGELVDTEKVFGPFRERWRAIKAKQKQKQLTQRDADGELGVLTDDELKFGSEAEQLRIDVTLAVRNEVLRVRRESAGLPDEDPKRGLAETFREEGRDKVVKPREGRQADGSTIKEM